MHDFTTCSISGLPIPGGTAVRCLLLTAVPPSRHYPAFTWTLRTPPLRAVYNGRGSIEKIHTDDTFIADLWLRGFREDLLERGLGDNVLHDSPVRRDMSLDELLEALRDGRVTVRSGTQNFGRNPETSPSLRTIEKVLGQNPTLTETFPHPISRHAAQDKFVVDEPVPNLTRVRFGRLQHGEEVLYALAIARVAIAQAGFVTVMAAGSEYARDAQLLVFATPYADSPTLGPQWDMAVGQPADPNRELAVAMALIREDVWHAVSRYPYSTKLAIDCMHCGQESWSHDSDRQCPDQSVNGKPFKSHSHETHYAHDPLLPQTVDHIVAANDYGQTLWYDLAAYRSGVRETWGAILKHFATHKPPTVARACEEASTAVGAREESSTAVSTAELLEHRKDPHFGDFLIDELFVRDRRQPGALIFHDAVPGILGPSAHLSMCLADKREVPPSLLDALAELSAVESALVAIGARWNPLANTHLLHPEWSVQLRFAQTVATIAQAEYMKTRDDEGGPLLDASETLDTCATLAEVQARLKQET